jgi:AcrR family transcriptional regulator
MPEQTRERILERARIVLAMGGRPTVDDFATAAGVSRTGFYRAFPSRQALLEALDRAPEPATPERILRAALEMIGEHGLAALSMDELADRARVSRATLYRLFPGKAALFAAAVEAFSPLDPVSRLLAARQADPPEALIPDIAREVHRSVYVGGEDRTGLLRAVFFEESGLSADTEQAMRQAVLKAVGGMLAYIQHQMSLGRLREMNPLIALQAFIGPVFFHLMTRRAVERMLGPEPSAEQAVSELAHVWLRAMAPEAAAG